ncbi:MAG: ChbG/HpnK family deacetylase [Nanoarchaeales archaeon]|nr:ChbG/HpnK family deacetylase [Nanoarchaeales archaeon]
MKKLIINADDFGYSEIFNESILDLIRENFLSSTTVMVSKITGNQSSQINELIEFKNSKNISVGLHLVFKTDSYYDEIEEQIEMFMDTFDFFPSHLDVHKSCGSEAEGMAVEKFCLENDLPCRKSWESLGNVRTTDKKVIDGTDIELDDLNELLEEMDENNSYEILFHPGTYDPECESSLNKDRELDIEKIKYICLNAEIFNIKLINFNKL